MCIFEDNELEELLIFFFSQLVLTLILSKILVFQVYSVVKMVSVVKKESVFSFETKKNLHIFKRTCCTRFVDFQTFVSRLCLELRVDIIDIRSALRKVSSLFLPSLPTSFCVETGNSPFFSFPKATGPLEVGSQGSQSSRLPSSSLRRCKPDDVLVNKTNGSVKSDTRCIRDQIRCT